MPATEAGETILMLATGQASLHPATSPMGEMYFRPSNFLTPNKYQTWTNGKAKQLVK
jgi:hypothetical protein